MTDQHPLPYRVKTRRCTIRPGRFRWDILERGTRVQSSAESYATRHEAEVAGRVEMEKLTRFGGLDNKG